MSFSPLPSLSESSSTTVRLRPATGSTFSFCFAISVFRASRLLHRCRRRVLLGGGSTRSWDPLLGGGSTRSCTGLPSGGFLSLRLSGPRSGRNLLGGGGHLRLGGRAGSLAGRLPDSGTTRGLLLTLLLTLKEFSFKVRQRLHGCFLLLEELLTLCLHSGALLRDLSTGATRSLLVEKDLPRMQVGVGTARTSVCRRHSSKASR
ncbi:hypothetical protein K466DRAFT_164673 [Polyporus arcularius HHB13444]|uniref:Uncharacterized protein n=1 Tax=Polyporus arcularius HHB13444 TaxID=1314778 RepID=A0A5C3P8S4_9APHY|nr:hypothetical protein K466DRAFT_164673 [Polyporus arcularius HHB13444]